MSDPIYIIQQVMLDPICIIENLSQILQVFNGPFYPFIQGVYDLACYGVHV